jgi:ferredoxin-fold anticodon binding domain-containing protein
MKNHVLLTEAYLETKALIERAKSIANLWSVEYRIKDFTKDCIKDGFSKEDIQLIFTILMNEQWNVANEELENEKLNAENN